MGTQRGIVAAMTVLAALAIWATATPAQLLAPKPAAVVNGTAITMAEVEAVVRQSGPSATPLTDMQRRQMQREALELLISDLLFQQTMRRIGRRIEVAEVNKEVAELMEGLRKQGKSFQDFLKESGMDEGELRTRIVTRLQWEDYIKAHFSEAHFHKYYEENRDFFDRVAVRASHIVMRVSPDAPPMERQAVLAKLEAVRQDVLAGKVDFAEAARKYSQDSSAANGGDIGYFPRKLVVDENYARAAYAMKVGQISDVIQTDFGMYLIKVTDRKPGSPADYNQIKEGVRELCVEEAKFALINQQRQAARIQINLP